MLDGEGTVKVYVHSNNIMVDLGDTIIINHLIDGQFINYKQIVPKDFGTVVTINKEQLEDAIDRASVLSRIDKNNLVKFDIKEKNLMLTSNSEIGNTKENITVGVKGGDLTISFNSKYFNHPCSIWLDYHIDVIIRLQAIIHYLCLIDRH